MTNHDDDDLADVCFPCGVGSPPTSFGQCRPLSPLPTCLYPSEVVEDEGIDDEVRVPKIRRAPDEPTDEERRVHDILHLPYRSWCDLCIKAKAESNPQFKSTLESKKERAHPTFHGDYWFMRNVNGVNETKAKILSVKEDKFKTYVGYWCHKKGRDGELAKNVCKDIANLGMGSVPVILKCDQENALGDLYNEVREIRSDETTLIEESPRYESKSNGVAENAVKAHEGHCRL